MGRDCCGQQASAPELMTAPDAASVEQTDVCQQSRSDNDDCSDCCSSGKCEDEKAQDETDQPDCCSSGECEDEKAQYDTNEPDCCRGKVSPCCDISCLDRLAIRECEMNAAAVLGSGAQTNGE